jgi:signal transduction histidine kinase
LNVALTTTTQAKDALAKLGAGQSKYVALVVDLDRLDDKPDRFFDSVREVSDVTIVTTRNLMSDSETDQQDPGALLCTVDPQPDWEVVETALSLTKHRTRRTSLKNAADAQGKPRLFAHDACALLAHDVKNCLYAAICVVDAVQHDLLGLDDTQRSSARLTASVHALKRISGLVENLVDLSSSDEVVLVPRRRVTDVAALARLAAAIYEPQGHDEANLEVRMPEELWVNIDPILVERIINNILSNAIRYVGQNDLIVIEGEIADGAELRLAIGNTGERIPDEIVPTLFDKHRLGKTQTMHHGMGLYFCRLACEAHGGSIALCPHPDFSTYFVIRLPDAGTPE